jgi:heme/copper-type cytochrome/quinol oxidase subunit 1
MKKITQAPHFMFWILIPIILLIGLLKPDKTLDINIHETYIIIALLHLAVLTSIIFGILGLGYWVVIKLNRRLVNWLTIIHLIITVISLCLIILIPFFLPESNQGITSLYFDAQVTITLSALVAVCIQSLYLVNIITALIRKTN